MSENIMHQITLDCLVNKEIYIKMQKQNTINNTNKKDKKFYRKRILNLARELLLKKEVNYNEINPDIKSSFDNFIKTCVHYFKIIDRNDILQEDYKNFDEQSQSQVNVNDLHNTNVYNSESDNKLFMRSIKMPNGLERFVKITTTKSPEEIILPKIKEIDLQEPNLRNKGIQKKENIAIK
jgi:hypothetical protein